MQQKIEEWIRGNEKKWKGCKFAISRDIFMAACKEKDTFTTLSFNERLFCNSMDREAILHFGGKQLVYPSMTSVIHLYQSCKRVIEEDDLTVWLFVHEFPETFLVNPPTIERIMRLYVNYPTNMEPAQVLMKEPILGVALYDIVKGEMVQKMKNISSDWNPIFDALWQICINPSRQYHHRLSLFAIPIATNQVDMAVPVDNICVSQTIEVMSQLMTFFDQPSRIDRTEIAGINYAWFDKSFFGPFFMILHGISLINASRLPAAFRTHPIRNLAHYYERYEKNAVPFATSAWFFTFIQTTWPKTGGAVYFRPVCKDIRLRIQEAVDGASRINLKCVLRDAYKKPTLSLIGMSDLIQTMQCALMEPSWIENHPPAKFTILIRSTLLRSMIETLPTSLWSDAWKASIEKAAESLHPNDVHDIAYIELQQYGAHICASMWSQRMDILSGRSPNVNAAWAQTLNMVSEYGFRMLLDGSRSTKETTNTIVIPPSICCFMEHVSSYSTVEVALRLFEIYWCKDCHKGVKCGHLIHDKEYRADVDLCDERVEPPSTFSESTPFAMVDAWLYYLFGGVCDPSVCRQVMVRAGFLPLTLLFH